MRRATAVASPPAIAPGLHGARVGRLLHSPSASPRSTRTGIACQSASKPRRYSAIASFDSASGLGLPGLRPTGARQRSLYTRPRMPQVSLLASAPLGSHPAIPARPPHCGPARFSAGPVAAHRRLLARQGGDIPSRNPPSCPGAQRPAMRSTTSTTTPASASASVTQLGGDTVNRGQLDI